MATAAPAVCYAAELSVVGKGGGMKIRGVLRVAVAKAVD